jgi:AcrR family transcriptional regulator
MLVKKQIIKKNCLGTAVRMSAEKRREQIAETAMRLFAENGFRGTTTKEIALAAGISEASLFQHFKTKAELYAAILDGKTKRVYESRWMDEVNEHIAGNEDEKVFRAIALKITEHCQSDPNFIRLMLYTALEKHENAQPFRRRMLYPVFELLRDYIEERKDEGFFQECNAEAAAFAFISTQIYYSMGNILFQSKMLTVTEDEAISNFIKLTLDGLRRNAPREKANNFVGENISKDLQN